MSWRPENWSELFEREIKPHRRFTEVAEGFRYGFEAGANTMLKAFFNNFYVEGGKLGYTFRVPNDMIEEFQELID